MKVSKREYRVASKMLDYWQDQHLVDKTLRQKMQDSMKFKSFDWQGLARYAFWSAVSCTLIALVAVLLDDKLMALIKQLFNAPLLVKSGFFLVLSALVFGWGFKIRQQAPRRVFSYDTLYFLGMVGIACSIFFLGAYLDTGSGHYSILVCLGALIYLLIGWLLNSGLVWGSGLLVIGVGFLTETGFQADWESHYLGMNYSLRIAVLGAMTGLISYGFVRLRFSFFQITRTTGLLYLFVGLWLLSINGNGDDWAFPGHSEVLPWILLFALASVAVLLLGIKLNDGLMRGMGLAFLFINAYTRYFEYVWDEFHGALFFALLAFSLWLISRYAEKLWLLGK